MSQTVWILLEINPRSIAVNNIQVLVRLDFWSSYYYCHTPLNYDFDLFDFFVVLIPTCCWGFCSGTRSQFNLVISKYQLHRVGIEHKLRSSQLQDLYSWFFICNWQGLTPVSHKFSVNQGLWRFNTDYGRFYYQMFESISVLMIVFPNSNKNFRRHLENFKPKLIPTMPVSFQSSLLDQVFSLRHQFSHHLQDVWIQLYRRSFQVQM